MNRRPGDELLDRTTVRFYWLFLGIIGLMIIVVTTLTMRELRARAAEETALRAAMQRYHVAEVQRTAEACSHYTCAPGTRCILTARGTACLK